MSQYSPFPASSLPKLHLAEDELAEPLSNIPLGHVIAPNEGNHRIDFLQSTAPKSTDSSLLHAEAFGRLSISTASSAIHSRGVSPYPRPSQRSGGSWTDLLRDFWETYEGLLLVAISQLFGALMNVTTRILELEGEGMHPFQILFARMGCTLVFCCAWLWWSRASDFPFGPKGKRLLLLARGMTGFFGIYGMYYALQYLPLADAVVITFLAPSVASYACYLFLQEPFPRSAQYASFVSLLGVVLIARPTSFLLPSSPRTPVVPSSSNTTTVYHASDSFPVPTSAQRLSAVLVALLGVLGTAGAFTTIRLLGPRIHPLLSVNYFALVCTITSMLALTLSTPLHISSTLHFALPASLRQWAMLTFLGICGFVMQFLLTKGLATGGRKEGAAATNMIYTNMLFALALDKIVFGTSPGWWSLAGSGLILGSAIWVAVSKGKGNRAGVGAEGQDDEEAGRRMRRDGIEEDEQGEEMPFLSPSTEGSRQQD